LTYLRRRIEELRAELLRRVELDQNGRSEDRSTGSSSTVAEERLRLARKRSPSGRCGADRDARAERDGVLQQSAVLDEQLKKLDAKVELTKQQMQGCKVNGQT